jgi:hypothetical protein
MKTKSFRYLSAACAALAALIGVRLALDSAQFLNDEFRTVATFGILMFSCGLLISSVSLVRWPNTGKVLAYTCVVFAMVFVVGGLSRMGNVPIGEALTQAICSRGAAICFPQVAEFVKALAVLVILLTVSFASSWRIFGRPD